MANVDENNYLDLIEGYLERTVKARKLVVPSVFDAGNETLYRNLFVESSNMIDSLYKENKRVIEEILNPIFSSTNPLSSFEAKFLYEFAGKLQDNSGVEYLDASLLWRISDRLFWDAMAKDDVDYLVRQIDLRIMACAGKAIQAKALNGSERLWGHYLSEGQKAVDILFGFLEKDKFKSIASKETKELIIVNSRFFCVVYESRNSDEKINEMVIKRLITSYEISFDKDYTSEIPEYNWVRHRIKCLEYMGQLTERNNEQGITKSQSKLVLEYVAKLKELYVANPREIEEYISKADIDLLIAKNRYYSDIISNEEYKNKLIYYYKNRFSNELGPRFKDYSTFINFQLPNEYIGELDRDLLSEEDIGNVEYIYQGVIMDSYSMSNKDEFTITMEYFTRLLEHYIEVPGGISFKDFCTHFMAATMPRYFIHTISVAELTRCVTRYLIMRRPEMFLGVAGAKNIDQVNSKRDAIIAYAYNAGIVHDIGKICLLPVLNTVERPLFPEEEELLNLHSTSARSLAKKAVSTMGYVNAISSHDSAYGSRTPEPDGYNHWSVPEKVIVDVVYLAEEIDKIMEKMERKGKTFFIKKLIPTLKRDSKVRFAPYLFNVLELPDLQRDIDFILNGGRDDIYRRTYVMLKSVMDRGRV